MSNPRLSLVHHGNAGNVRQAAQAFAEAGLLQEVITTLAYNPNAEIWRYFKLLPSQLSSSIHNELSRRTWHLHSVPIYTYPGYEILRLFLLKTKLSQIFGLTGEKLGNWLYPILDSQVAKHHLQELTAIYSYEDIAAQTFEQAKKQGILCLYDLPIPFYQTPRRIMQEEAELFPGLATSIQTINEPDWKLQRKHQEIELADHIFVASSVTKQSLLDIAISADKISVIHYGSPVEQFKPQPKVDDCFRVIFTGRFSPLKGIHYLLQAWKELNFKNAELLLVGENRFPDGWLEKYYSGVYRHIPSISHFVLNEYYSQGSVFVLPSLIDGFGLSAVEAMACSLPVIVTFNTGAKDIITDNVEGFIIPIRDVEAIKEKLDWCYSHPQELANMGRNARQKAEELHWGVYRQKLASRVTEIINNTICN